MLAINDQVDQARDILLLMEGLHRRPGLEHALGYLSESSEKHPELLVLLEKFDIKPESSR